MVMLKPLLKPSPGIKRPSVNKRVTIAAGFKLEKSLLLCADSLYTDGFTQHYGDKIFSHPLGTDVDALFAIAGSVPHAKSFLQHLRNAMAGKRHSLALAKETLSMETAEFSNTHSQSIGESGLQVIAAIRHRDEGLSLMVCDDSACYETAELYEFVGCGRSIAKPLTDWMYPFVKTDQDHALLAFTVLSVIKSIDPNCGGMTQYGTLCADSSKDFLDTKTGAIEQEGFARCFFQAALDTFFGCSKQKPAEEVSHHLKLFEQTIRMLHEFPDIQEPKI
ncbi:MAG TPA: hypothetical protein VI386_30300 [Candidatus Sulfotelmatobacter sp.]